MSGYASDMQVEGTAPRSGANSPASNDVSVKRKLEDEHKEDEQGPKRTKAAENTDSETLIDDAHGVAREDTGKSTEEQQTSPTPKLASPQPAVADGGSRQVDRLPESRSSSTVSPVPQIPITKPCNSKSATPELSKSALIAQSGRKIEDIIDGSDLRKFLHKSLSEYMVKGLERIVDLWETGEFETANTEHMDDKALTDKVVLKFADILRQLTEE